MSMPIATHLLEHGVKRILSPFPKNRLWWGAAALGMSGLAISQCLHPGVKEHLRSLQSWQIYRLPSLRSLSGRKLAIEGISLVFAAAIIYASYPYLGVFLNSPFPKSFSLR